MRQCARARARARARVRQCTNARVCVRARACGRTGALARTRACVCFTLAPRSSKVPVVPLELFQLLSQTIRCAASDSPNLPPSPCFNPSFLYCLGLRKNRKNFDAQIRPETSVGFPGLKNGPGTLCRTLCRHVVWVAETFPVFRIPRKAPVSVLSHISNHELHVLWVGKLSRLFCSVLPNLFKRRPITKQLFFQGVLCL